MSWCGNHCNKYRITYFILHVYSYDFTLFVADIMHIIPSHRLLTVKMRTGMKDCMNLTSSSTYSDSSYGTHLHFNVFTLSIHSNTWFAGLSAELYTISCPQTVSHWPTAPVNAQYVEHWVANFVKPAHISF